MIYTYVHGLNSFVAAEWKMIIMIYCSPVIGFLELHISKVSSLGIKMNEILKKSSCMHIDLYFC